MLFKGWMANTTGEDMRAMLERNGAYEIQITPSSDEEVEYPEAQWFSFCDEDDEIIKILKIMLWYNDRSDEQIEQAAQFLKKFLEENPRMGNRS